jgi:alginate O-acetyltransferase complex protein AlgI
MLFNSYPFIFLFLPITFAGFFFIARRSHEYAAIWLGLASVVFYGYWSIKALPLLLGSICVNYWFGKYLIPSEGDKDHHRRKLLLITSLVINLGLLVYFKYANFFIHNANALLRRADLSTLDLLDIVLPLGISFFTFTQIAFLIDSYQGKVKERKFSHYLLFVTFFPHLIAGPIIHHKQMMPQFARPETYRMNFDKIAMGLAIFTIGLSKKMLLADPLGTYAAMLFDSYDVTPQFFLSWFGSLAYTFQIYFDFSGYSDMAVGLALLFGIVLPVNFNAPYKATSMISFWQRWHMTLTSYVWEYLYTPLALKGVRHSLGKGRWTELRYSLIVPTTLSFLLIGFWHGASWNYIAFGLLQAVLIIINQLWRTRSGPSYIPLLASRVFSWFITFFCINSSIVMFRAGSIRSAFDIYKGMLGFNGFSVPHRWAEKFTWLASLHGISFEGVWQELALSIHQSNGQFFKLMVVSFFIILVLPSSARLVPAIKTGIPELTITRSRWIAIGLALLFVLSVLSFNKTSPFLYFQF